MNLTDILDWSVKISPLVIAFATLVYATLTYFLLREQRREKEKPRIEEMFDVIILPSWEQLHSNLRTLKQGNFGWRYGGYTNIAKLKTRFSFGAERLVYENFERAYSGSKITRNIHEHDEKVERLEKALNELAKKIDSPDFRKMCIEQVKKYSKEAPAENKISSHLVEDSYRYILEDIINNRKELDESNAYCGFWEKHGKSFLKYRENARAQVDEVKRIAKSLEKLSEELLSDLRNIINHFQEEYGISVREYYKERKFI